MRGLDDKMQATARAFADAGMSAVVWDPYNGEGPAGMATPAEPGKMPPPDLVFKMMAKLNELEDRSMVRDLTSVVDYMQDELGLASIAGIGWCFGGRVALVHAGSDDRICAVSASHPTIWGDTPIEFMGKSLSSADFPGETLDAFELAASINGPVQICHPGEDFVPQPVYDKLLASLRARPERTVYEFFPGASHGFSFAPGEANEKARRQAWSTTLALFSERFEPLEAASVS